MNDKEDIYEMFFFFCYFLDMTLNEKVRAQIPISKQRRTDLYETVSKK